MGFPNPSKGACDQRRFFNPSQPLNALQSGFALLDRGAAEVVNAGEDDASSTTATDSVDVRGATPANADPMLTGIRDLMLAKVQVRAGAALLHAYSENRQDLFDLLRD